MSNSTVSVNNSRSQSIDTLWLPDGSKRIKLGIGTKDVSTDTEDAAWQAVASHTDGETFDTNDGVLVLAGVDGTTVRKVPADANGRLIVSPVPQQGNLTDESGTISSGGTQQTLAAVNTARRYLMVQNLDASEDLWINFGSNAVIATAGSIQIKAGATFTMEGAFVSTQLVSVIAATTAHKFTAKEG